MKVLFLCGGLEPGKDGVGDYTRKLAGALMQMGHNASIISIHDKHVAKIVSSKQVEMKHDIDVLRLPASLSWKKKIEVSKDYINSKEIDWLSLQYVPYSFNKKGLPIGLSNWLKQIGGGYRWHIMFHELWLGIKSDAPAKHYIYGFIQKRLISALIKKLAPRIINTSNRVYQLELQKRDIQAEILPLFSNIALLEPDQQLINKIYKALNSNPTEVTQFYILGGFGAVHHGINLKEVIIEQSLIAAKQQKKLVYISFGRSSFDKEAETLQAELKDKALFCNLGQLSELQLSTVLQVINIGVCGTPKEYIGKSGVYAAMKLHALPVIMRSGMVIPEYEAEIEQFNNYLESRPALEWDVAYTATKFYENIRLYTNI